MFVCIERVRLAAAAASIWSILFIVTSLSALALSYHAMLHQLGWRDVCPLCSLLAGVSLTHWLGLLPSNLLSDARLLAKGADGTAVGLTLLQMPWTLWGFRVFLGFRCLRPSTAWASALCCQAVPLTRLTVRPSVRPVTTISHERIRIRSGTRNQWRSRRSGVMRSERLSEKTSRAAALRTDWSLSRRWPETPTSIEQQ